MTGNQEILTGPVLCRPDHHLHVFRISANVGVNERTSETVSLAANARRRGVILHRPLRTPSKHRARRHLDPLAQGARHHWARRHRHRALTSLIRRKACRTRSSPRGDGRFDLDALKAEARAWPGLVGMDLVPMVTCGQRFHLGRNAVAVDISATGARSACVNVVAV